MPLNVQLVQKQITKTPAGLAQLRSQASVLEYICLTLILSKENPIVQQRFWSVERDLRYVQARLENALIIDPTSQSKATVLFGASVSIEDEHGDPHQYNIVGVDEADIAPHKVSWLSPIAKAMLGNKVGDIVIWKRPAGDLNLEILAIN